MLSDTHPDAERVQIELLRQMTPEERLRMAFGLTATMVNLSRQTIAALNPGLDARELNLKCVELYYGKELASRLREYLQTRTEVVNAVASPPSRRPPPAAQVE
ncbi:MAG: hypothetical protein ABFC96_17635 [Thermoguttaceae bacterium]